MILHDICKDNVLTISKTQKKGFKYDPKEMIKTSCGAL